jgi:chromosomal replication initiator protein
MPEKIMIITIRDVERAVCQRFKLSHDQLLCRNTARKVSRPRQLAMYLARELTGASYPRLGQHFARDHTSVLYAWRMTVKRMGHDARLRAQIESCKKILERSGLWKEKLAREMAAHGLEPAHLENL